MLSFRPAILSAFTDYRRADFFADLSAGLTVGIIALPLAIGFAIASGATPQQGLWTGIVAGLAVSLLGGSRFQIAGPTGAFVPVLFSIIAQYGYGGLALAAMMAGVMLITVGALKMGRLLKFFPYPVIAGFTSGIAVIIFCGQLNEFLGLGLKMPEHVPQQLTELVRHLPDLNWHAFAVGAALARDHLSVAATDQARAGEHRRRDRHRAAGTFCRLARCDHRQQVRRDPERLAGLAFSRCVA